MTITRQTVARQLAAYLHHEITLQQLVDWSEQAMMDGEFAEPDMPALRAVVSLLAPPEITRPGPRAGANSPR